MSKLPEPFGYFRADSMGWTDCAETDEGAQALYDQATVDLLINQRDELLEALESVKTVAESAFTEWDNDRDTKVGKYLIALCGNLPGYDKRTDEIHAAIASVKGGAE